MQDVLWLNIGKRKIHLVKMIGSFLLIAAILKVFESVYQLILVSNQAAQAMVNAETAKELFGYCIECGGATARGFTGQDVLGVMLGPFAGLLFWIAITIVAIMIYQTGKVILPIRTGTWNLEGIKPKEKATKKPGRKRKTK